MTPLRARREALRIPKKEIGRRLDADPYLYGRVEGGSVKPSVRTVATIAALLGADARELFDLHPCGCGCGTLVPRERTWAWGHDRGKGAQARRYWSARRRELGVPEQKTCEQCRRVYTRKRSQNTEKWLRQRWCSAACWRQSEICRTAPHERRWDELAARRLSA